MSRSQTGASPPRPLADPFANKEWTVDVDVWLDLHSSGLRFTLETYLPRNPANDNIIFHNHRRPGYIVRFNLRDPRNTGYVFPNNPADALSSSTGPGCPTGPGQWPGFAAAAVTNGGRSLEVRNRNNGHQDFSYTMWVSTTGSAPFTPLDPGGEDRNGPAS